MKLQEIKDALMDFVDDRKMFHESWLFEMPGLAGKLDTFPSMSIMLADFLKHGFQKNEVEKDIFKIKAADKMYYWVERNANPVLIVEISVSYRSLVVNMLGKSSEVHGLPPYTTDLYKTILNDNSKSLLMSDEYLTDSSFKVWSKLLDSGCLISVYDTKTAEPISVSSSDELKKYYHSAGNRFRFILSKSATNECLINADFRLYRFRRDNSIL